MIKSSKTALATLLAIIAQIIFGFSFMFTKISQNYASPLTVIADRYIVALLCLTVIVVVSRTKIRFRGNFLKLIIMSLFQPILYFLFESYGIKLTTSAFSSVMISVIPVVSMISGIIFLKEIPSPIQYVFTFLSVLGVAISAFSGKMDGSVSFMGIVLLLGAVISSVAYNITSRKISSEFTPFERTYAMTLIGSVVFIAMAVFENIHNPLAVLTPMTSPSYLLSVGYLGLFSSVIAFFALNYANTYLPVSKTTVFTNFTTVVSVSAGIIFLDEPFSVLTVISTLLIVTGVLGVQLCSVKDRS